MTKETLKKAMNINSEIETVQRNLNSINFFIDNYEEKHCIDMRLTIHLGNKKIELLEGDKNKDLIFKFADFLQDLYHKRLMKLNNELEKL